MRVIAGTAGRLELRVPRGDALRPTQDKVRGAIFSMLGDAVADARVLDLFAGTGAFGIEALSRGAASAVFVEKQRPCLDAIRHNLAHTRLADHATVTAGDARLYCDRSTDTFDLIFADPPYEKVRGAHPDVSFFAGVARCLVPGGTFVFEFHAYRAPLDPGPFVIASDRKYGETGVWLLRHP